MGLVGVKITVRNTETAISKEVELLVDTDSIFTWVSKEVLEEIDIKSKARLYETVDGGVVGRVIGIATISYKRFEDYVEIVFAEKDDAEVSGVVALETLGLEVDPIKRELRHVDYLAI